MKIKLDYPDWCRNQPVIIEFEGTEKEFNNICKKYYVVNKKIENIFRR